MAQNQPLAWELPCASGAALKKKKKIAFGNRNNYKFITVFFREITNTKYVKLPTNV